MAPDGGGFLATVKRVAGPWLPWLRRGFAIVLVVAVLAAVVAQWPDVQPKLRQLSPVSLIGAVAALACALWLAMLGWRVVLADLGSPLPLRVSSRIYFVGQAGKYLPGSVWPVLMQMEMGREEHVPRTRMAVSFGVSLALSILVALTIGLPTLFTGGQNWLVAVAGIAIGAPLLLVPPVLNAVISGCLRLLRRPPLEHPLSARTLWGAVLLYAAAWVAYGLHVWVLVVDVGGSPLAALPVSVGAYAVAATLGVLFIVAPAGAGVREVLLVIGLGPVLGTAAATAVVVVSRLLVTLADVAAAGLSAFGYQRHKARERAPLR